MTLEDLPVPDPPPERVFDFFEHMDETHLAWHPDHVALRWAKGRGLHPGVEFAFEERVGGTLMNKASGSPGSPPSAPPSASRRGG